MYISADTISCFLAIWNFSNAMRREIFGVMNGYTAVPLMLGEAHCVPIVDTKCTHMSFHTHISTGMCTEFSPPSAEDICMLLAQCIRTGNSELSILVLAAEGIYIVTLSKTLVSEIYAIMNNKLVNFTEKQNSLRQFRDALNKIADLPDFSNYQKQMHILGVRVDQMTYTFASP